MSNQPVIRGPREAKIYAIAVVTAFILVPVLVVTAFATGGFWLFILAVVVGFVATRYSRHLTAYTRHQKENQ